MRVHRGEEHVDTLLERDAAPTPPSRRCKWRCRSSRERRTPAQIHTRSLEGRHQTGLGGLGLARGVGAQSTPTRRPSRAPVEIRYSARARRLASSVVAVVIRRPPPRRTYSAGRAWLPMSAASCSSVTQSWAVPWKLVEFSRTTASCSSVASMQAALRSVSMSTPPMPRAATSTKRRSIRPPPHAAATLVDDARERVEHVRRYRPPERRSRDSRSPRSGCACAPA